MRGQIALLDQLGQPPAAPIHKKPHWNMWRAFASPL
jgi:hypothetical protein